MVSAKQDAKTVPIQFLFHILQFLSLLLDNQFCATSQSHWFILLIQFRSGHLPAVASLGFLGFFNILGLRFVCRRNLLVQFALKSINFSGCGLNLNLRFAFLSLVLLSAFYRLQTGRFVGLQVFDLKLFRRPFQTFYKLLSQFPFDVVPVGIEVWIEQLFQHRLQSPFHSVSVPIGEHRQVVSDRAIVALFVHVVQVFQGPLFQFVIVCVAFLQLMPEELFQTLRQLAGESHAINLRITERFTPFRNAVTNFRFIVKPQIIRAIIIDMC